MGRKWGHTPVYTGNTDYVGGELKGIETSRNRTYERYTTNETRNMKYQPKQATVRPSGTVDIPEEAIIVEKELIPSRSVDDTYSVKITWLNPVNESDPLSKFTDE